MLKFIVPLVMFVALGAFLFIGLQRDPAYVPSPLIGKPAPEFSLPSLQDAAYPISTKDLAGQPWVLNVWGTWCGGCRQEHDEEDGERDGARHGYVARNTGTLADYARAARPVAS